MKRIRPYPFDRLARLARSQVQAGRSLLAHLPHRLGSGMRIADLADCGPIDIQLGECYAFSARELKRRIGVAVAFGMRGPAERQAVLVVDAVLGLRLARRALGDSSLGLGFGLAVPRPLATTEQAALLGLAAGLVAGTDWRVASFWEDPARRPLADDATELGEWFSDPWVLALELRLVTPLGPGWAQLLAPERLGWAVAPVPPADVLLSRSGRIAMAQVRLRMEVGRTRIDRRELARLGPRDVVLFDEFGPRPPLGGPLWLRLGRGGFRGHLDGNGLTLLDGFTLALGGSPMSLPLEEPFDPAPRVLASTTTDAQVSGLLGELPVELICELGRVTMSGRELLELRPGAVIPVGRPLAGPVDLTVGGRIVARGELVDVEGEIGVRIIQMHD